MPFGSHLAGEEAILETLSENTSAVIFNNDSVLVTGDKLLGTFDKLEVYCNTLCPFHVAQIVLNKISGINLKISQKYARLLNKTPDILLWFALIFIFLSSNPTISSYEPFAMLFSLEGVGIQWYILPTTLIGALFFSNFFCRFFCPVGGALRWMLKMRKQVKLLISDKRLKN